MTCLDDSSLPFLHGTLVIRIEEAKDLPDLDRLVVDNIVDSMVLSNTRLALGGTAARMSLMLLSRLSCFPLESKLQRQR